VLTLIAAIFSKDIIPFAWALNHVWRETDVIGNYFHQRFFRVLLIQRGVPPEF